MFVWLVFVLFCCYQQQINISLRSVLFPPLSPSFSVIEFKTWPSFKFVLWKQWWQGSTDNKGDQVEKKTNWIFPWIQYCGTVQFMVAQCFWYMYLWVPPPPFNESLGKKNLDNVFFLTISKLLCYLRRIFIINCVWANLRLFTSGKGENLH